ncbi:IucA/IucC family C-terminal-domain containing protein [Cytobacillus sp. FJAT-54145]|uniref:IucA/IucC family C-terminal-domain containing protein n=1 Tax=Cytobacillus spartinae TaxID=3299023 RepID=A0ABW6KDI4_9BACI
MPKILLTNEETEQLSNYRFSNKSKPTDSTIELVELLKDEQSLLNYMEELSKVIGSPNLKVTASIFVKRYAFLAVIYLYSMTKWNKSLDISIDRISLQTKEDDEHWLPSFYFKKAEVEAMMGERNEWRDRCLQNLFSNHLSIVLSALSLHTKQSKLIMWENIAIYIFWLYESVFTQVDDDELKNRASEDFHYIMNEAPGCLFGKYHNNPLKRHFHQKSYVEHLQEEVRVRTSCCFSYMLEGSSDKCKICPQTCNIPKRGGVTIGG